MSKGKIFRIQWLLMLFFGILLKGQAQKFSTYVGGGLGSTFSKKFEGCESNSPGRFAFYLAEHLKLSNRLSIGLAFYTADKLSGLLGGANPCSEKKDMVRGVTVLNNYNLPSSSLLLKGHYSPLDDLYLGLVSGLTFHNYTVNNEQQRNTTSFVFGPEIGLNVSRFQFSGVFIVGANTPDFKGFDSFSNRNVELNSISTNQLLFTAAYRLFQSKK